jgi:hypothetical protein
MAKLVKLAKDKSLLPIAAEAEAIVHVGLALTCFGHVTVTCFPNEFKVN